MDGKSLQMLEFPKIRRIIAGFTTFPLSYELAESLVPSSDPRIVSLLLKQSTEARQLLELNPDFSIGGATDIREPVALAAREKTLDPQTLIKIQATIAAANHLKSRLSKSDNEFPSLWDIAEQITMLPHIEQEISRCIDAAGDIMESASPTLVALRQQLKETRQLLLIRLENIVKSLSSQNLLQDSIITERSGRYVVPVKVEHQSEVKGMIHDISNTGATVFIEPWAIVKDGNTIKQLALEEQREVNRILAHLSEEVGSHASEIS
ncbi:MAG: endonuclease MutS2, partial [Chloroflexi bacterium]|nr:endonuclease MutS2 [Chloroflexota bacterium]